MRLLFARHGESVANTERIISNRDLPHHLTPTGIAQATALAEQLAGQPVGAIWASPIVRAQETASIVAERLGLMVMTTPALREFDCGRAEGRGDAEAWALHDAVSRAWEVEQSYDRRIEPDGESFNDLRARFVPFVGDLIAQYRHTTEDVLLITHGALLYLMLPLVLTNIDSIFAKTHQLGNCVVVAAHLEQEQLVCSQWADVLVGQ